MAGRGKVFISHAAEDAGRLRQLLALFDTWGVDYWFEAHGQLGGEQLADRVQLALAECAVLLRICTPAVKDSYWMGLEIGAFLSLQAEDQRAGRGGQRILVNFILDKDYERQPFDYASPLVDAARQPEAEWLTALRAALGLPPLAAASSPAIDLRAARRPISRRRVLAAGAGVVALGVAGATGTLLLTHTLGKPTVKLGAGTPGAKATAAATPTVRDPKLLWFYKAGDVIEGGAAVADGNVFFGSWDQTFYALDAKTGAKRWTTTGQDKFRHDVVPIGDTIYFRFGGVSIVGLDPHTGNIVWQVNSLGGLLSGPVIVSGVVYGGEGANPGLGVSGSLDGFSLPSKNFVWDGEAPGSVIATTIVNGIAYVGTDQGYVLAFDTSNADPNAQPVSGQEAKGRAIWPQPFKTGDKVHSNPAVANGVVYVGSDDGYLYALDAATGALNWKFKTGSAVETDPVVVDGLVVFGSADGGIYGVDAATSAQRWKVTTGDAVYSSPVYSGGLFYAGSLDRSVRGIAPDGTVAKQFKTGGKIAARPAIAGGVLYIGTGDGFMYAFNV